MKVGLIGATGLVGGHALRLLLEDEDIAQLRVWARQNASLTHRKLDWQCIDFDQLETLVDCAGLDAVLCALGTTQAQAGKDGLKKVDHDYVLAMAQAAQRAQVPGFCLVSALGASTTSPSFYSRIKAQAEQSVEKLGFASLEILRPSLLLGERQDARPMEALGQKLSPVLNALLPGPLKHYRAIAGAEVAASMIRLAKAAEPGTHIRLLPLDH